MGKSGCVNRSCKYKGIGDMKIGINATFLDDKPTGTGVFTKEISRCICKLHNKMTLISPVYDSEMPSSRICKVPEAMRGSPRFLNNLYRVSYINTILPMLCKLKGVDVLYCPIAEFPYIPVVPLVTHIHDLHPIHFPSQFGLSSPRMKLSLKVIGHIAKRVVVSSEFVKNELIESTTIKETMIDVVPLAYSNKMFKPMPTELKEDFLRKYNLKGKYILFVSNLFPYKNLTTLVKAFLRIKEEIPHSLVIIGRSEFSAEPIVNERRILYMDYVQGEDLALFYSYTDLFVYPSLREGFGIPPLEAMACGTPVISSNGGSLPEVIGDAGIFFEPQDSKSLSELILKVVKDERLRREMIVKGLEHVKKFSWEKTAEGILESCEKALNRKQ